MSRRLLLGIVTIVLTGLPVRAQTPSFFSRGTIPTRTAMARVGLERHWSGLVPMGHGNERLLIISQAGDMLFAQTNMANFHAYDAETGRYLWGAEPGTADGRCATRLAKFRPGLRHEHRYALLPGQADRAHDVDLELEALPASATAADEESVMVGLVTGKLVAYTSRDHTRDRPPGRSAGRLAWAWKTNAPLTGRAIPTERVVAFASQDKRVYVAIHETPPRLLYRYLTNGAISAAMGTYGTRTLLVPSADQNLYAIDLFLAETRWIFSSGAPLLQEPMVAGTTVYVINKDGRLTALDVETGKPRWDVSTGHGQLQALSPTRVYLRSHDRDLMVVERTSGQVLADARTTLERGGLNLREFTLAPTNSTNDRLYYATPSGALLCLREMGRTMPTPLRDPKAQKFGFVPIEGEILPPAVGAETVTPPPADLTAPDAKPEAPADKPVDEAKPAEDAKPK